MIIHVVRPGESIYTIARLYGVSPSSVIANNELANPGQLVVGQTLVILRGVRKHRVNAGESLYSIAREYGVGLNDLMAANPGFTAATALQPGQIINVPGEPRKLGTIDVNGYAFPSIKMDALRKTLPHLTYLSIFSYQVKPDGSLTGINDTPLIQAARTARVAPIMVITDLEEGGGFSGDIARAIFNNNQAQENLLNNVIRTLREKNYFGLDIDFEYIYEADREKYNNFLRKVVARLRPLGYTIATALAPKTSATQQGRLYEAHDYPVHGALADHVILMTYEWGFTYSPPMAVAPVNEIRKVLNYAVTAIPRKKILMGAPNYGYNWILPYRQGTAAKAISNTAAVNLALRERTAIQYDYKSQAPFFRYYDDARRQHEVWFEDARSIYAKMQLINQYNLGGISYWTIGNYFPQNWLVLSSLYNVRKVI